MSSSSAAPMERHHSIDAQLRLLAPGKVSEDDKLVEYDALLVDRFLDILQDLHGPHLREFVQDCYEVAAEYEGDRDAARLDELGGRLTGLAPADAIVVASSFSHMLNLANLAEEVQIANRRRNKLKRGDFADEASATTESDIEETLKMLVSDLGKTREEVFDALKNQTVDLVFTAHPTQSIRRSLLQKHGRIRNCLRQLYAKDITADDKQELDEALQREADMTLELHEEVASYRRQLSSTALLEPRPVHSFFTRIEGKLRAIYQAITCTRSTDVVLQQPQVRPPRHSTGQQEPTQHRHQPRPRVDHQWSSRPPPPNQAGSSAWQHHHDPLSGYGFRPHPQQHGPPPSFVMHQHPTGAYGYRAPMSGHEASHSDSTFDSAPDGGHNTQDQVSQHITNWMDTHYSTPPPDPTQPTQPTQDTQYGEDGSWIPLRNVRPPNRYGWPTPPPPQPRRGRGRRG